MKIKNILLIIPVIATLLANTTLASYGDIVIQNIDDNNLGGFSAMGGETYQVITTTETKILGTFSILASYTNYVSSDEYAIRIRQGNDGLGSILFEKDLPMSSVITTSPPNWNNINLDNFELPAGTYTISIQNITPGGTSDFVWAQSDPLTGTYAGSYGVKLFTILEGLSSSPVVSNTTGGFNLPASTELTATAQDTLSSVMPYLLLFAGIPLGFYILYRITRLMPDNDKK